MNQAILSAVKASLETQVLMLRKELPDGSVEWDIRNNVTKSSMRRALRIGLEKGLPCELQLNKNKTLRAYVPKYARIK